MLGVKVRLNGSADIVGFDDLCKVRFVDDDLNRCYAGKEMQLSATINDDDFGSELLGAVIKLLRPGRSF